MLLGGLIGYERGVASKPAGLLTHMMLAGACALLIGLGWAGAMLAQFSRLHPGFVSADPFRLVKASSSPSESSAPAPFSGPIRITGRTAVVPLHFATAFWVGAN